MRTLLAITKALADAPRLRILAALGRGGELCVCQLQALLDLAPSTTSRHLSLLAAAGLVVARKEGRWVYYRLPTPADEDIPPAARAALQWMGCCATDADAPFAADRARLDAILRYTPEELCQLQHPGLACCSSAPETPAAARSPKDGRAPCTPT